MQPKRGRQTKLEQRGEIMKKLFLGAALFMVFCSSSSSLLADGYAGSSPYYRAESRDYGNDRGGNSPYYNSQNNDYSNYRGGNDINYNAQDNRRAPISGDDNSYRGSNGMIYNK